MGGGGEIVNANCKSPFWVAKRTVEIFEEIKKEETKARMIICVGPSFKYLDKLKKEVKRRKLKIKLISFEKNLPELFTLSSLIISTAGYNVCNEIVQARVPSVLVPLDRDSKEQYERAKFLKNVGVARVVDKDSKNIFKKEVKSALKNTKKMKKSFLKLNLGKIKRNKVVKELL